MLTKRLKKALRQPLYHNLQNLVRPPRLRRLLGKIEGLTKPSKTLTLESEKARSIYEALMVKGHTEDLELITPAQAVEMRTALEKSLLKDPLNLKLGEFTWNTVPKSVRRGFPPIPDVVNLPHIFALAKNPDILAALEAIFGCKPQVAMMQGFWRFPSDGPEDYTESWHRDFETLRFIKLFLYLTDVTSDSGPHFFVEGSHLDDRIRKFGFTADKAVRDAYGNERVIQKLGKAGTCFLEETNGWHKGDQVSGHPRLVVQVVYAVHPQRHRDKPLIKAEDVKGVRPAELDRYLFQNHLLP